MFEKVLIGIDERPSNRDAIQLARALVAPGGTLVLAHVDVSYRHYARGLTTMLEHGESHHGDQLLRDVSAASGIETTVSMSAGSVGRGLHELVEREGADLLVLGSTHQGLVGRVLVGDNTHDAINGAPCALAIAPGAHADTPETLRKVGVAYNQSDEAKHALAVARELAAACNARVSVFEAVSLPTYVYYGYSIPYGDIAADTLESVRSALAAIEGVEPQAALGDPAEELTLFSASVDLLVVGSRGFGPLGRLVHSSTSMRLARSSRCPLLILPRTARTPDSVGSDVGSPVPATAVA